MDVIEPSKVFYLRVLDTRADGKIAFGSFTPEVADTLAEAEAAADADANAEFDSLGSFILEVRSVRRVLPQPRE